MAASIEEMLDAVEWTPVAPPENTEDGLPYATHTGKLNISGWVVDCVVLNTGQRLFVGPEIEELFRNLGMEAHDGR